MSEQWFLFGILITNAIIADALLRIERKIKDARKNS